MATFIDSTDIGSAWLQAYEALQGNGHAVNLSVAISDPLHEDLGIRHAIETRLVQLKASGANDFKNAQSMHTVANTIFPIGLYRPESENAALRFLANVQRAESLRAHSPRRRWGTYIGRLTAYPARDGGTTNQLRTILETLKGKTNRVDAYEMPLEVPGGHDGAPDDVTAGAVLHGDVRCDALKRGGPCLAHISLTRLKGVLSMVALYRAHTYEARAYGNFLGLARLLAFLATESDLEVGELLVVTGHAYATAPSKSALFGAASKAAGTITPIETFARPLGASVRDLDLPALVP